jgi:hypothetical protein
MSDQTVRSSSVTSQVTGTDAAEPDGARLADSPNGHRHDGVPDHTRADGLLREVRAAAGDAGVAAELALRDIDAARARLGDAISLAIVAAEDAGTAEGLLAIATREHAAITIDSERGRGELERAAAGAVAARDRARVAQRDARDALIDRFVPVDRAELARRATQVQDSCTSVESRDGGG